MASTDDTSSGLPHGTPAPPASLQGAEPVQHTLLWPLLQALPQGCWLLDHNGITTDVNLAMCTLLGLPREQVVGRAMSDFIRAPDLQALQQALATRHEGRTVSCEAGLLRPDGTHLHGRGNITPLHHADGRLAGWACLWADLTAQAETEHRLHIHERVVESITDMVSVIGEDLVYRMVNDAWCRSTGVPREQALGRRACDLFPGVVRGAREQALAECLRLQQPRVLRERVDLPGVHGRMLETTYYPHADAAGGVRCVVLVTRDVTAELQALEAAQASRAELAGVLAAFPGYIAGVDGGDAWMYANDRVQRLYGLTREQLLGQPLHMLVAPGRLDALRDELRRARDGQETVTSHHYPATPARPAISLEITHVAGPLQPDGSRHCYSFGTDITARLQAEQALVAARDEAEQANRAKSRFLSQMSHELRTPLNAILGYAQLLDSELQAPQRQHVQQILDGAQRLLALINEVLELGRIEAGELVLECTQVPLQPLLAACLESVAALARARAVRLPPAVGDGLVVTADSARLQQVLLSLLGNAVKYNRPGGEVGLHCAVDGGEVVITVRDTGPGLGAAERERLFEPFERLQAVRAGIDGTGIGLAVSRRLVLGMGGRIGVHSVPGQGSDFWLRLPAAAPVLPAPAPVPDPGATVLYIEDNPVNVALMQAMLQRLPWLRLLVADDPVEGLALALRERPALVLLDIQMPGLDGFEVLQRLRADPATRDIPTIAVSANARQDDIDAALAAGFGAYLTKPLAMKLLLATVCTTLGRPAVG